LPCFLCCSLFCSFILFICIASVVGLSHCWFVVLLMLLVLQVRYIVFSVADSSRCFYCCWFVTTFATIGVLCCVSLCCFLCCWFVVLLVMLLIPRYSSEPLNYCLFVLFFCIDGCYSLCFGEVLPHQYHLAIDKLVVPCVVICLFLPNTHHHH
jgi:hypothetical protein